MGLHRDRDELEVDVPIISVSLGDSCLFRAGWRTRNDPPRAIGLSSGDVLALGGASRLAFHGSTGSIPALQACSRRADGSI
jgi:alkylated DNA repair protein (DNA oxidative demethylase)